MKYALDPGEPCNTEYRDFSALNDALRCAAAHSQPVHVTLLRRAFALRVRVTSYVGEPHTV